jgi:Arc/MetJ-type ribon-helix-helix transcriptional regulator
VVRRDFYSNRSDFIRTAIRTQLARQSDAVKQSVARRRLDLGLRRYSRLDLEALRTAGETLHIQVLGALQASPEVKAALSDRSR